jgi:Na+/H+ antiporter NhaA
MLGEQTNWPRLYATAVLLGAGFGLLASLGLLAWAPDWPAVVTIAGGALTGLLLAAAAHLGVRLQLRRRSSRGLGE